MTAIAISNTRPGFMPLSPRSLSIVGQTPRPQYRAAYTPVPYRPPMLSNPPPQMSSPSMGFSVSDIPLSLTLGAAGAGAMILAGIVPSPVKEISTVLGLGLIGFGLLNLISAPASAAEASTPSSGAKPFRAATADEFQLVSAKITKPASNEVADRGAFSYDYDIEVLWTNSSSKAVTIPYRIYVDEKPQPVTVAGMPLSTTIIPFKGVAYTGTVKLDPGESVTVPLEIDLKSEGFMAGGVIGVTLTVQKISSAGQIFDADRRFFVVK